MGLPFSEVTDFSVNLNPLGMPSIIRENWNDLISEVKDYPDIEGSGITGFYCETMGIKPENVLAGNGSTELIYLIPRVLGFKRVLIVVPSFNDYERGSFLAGASVDFLRLAPENMFDLPCSKDLHNAVLHADAVWLGRPNNPTANLFPKEMIYDLIDRYPEKMFIVDEAFIHFSDNWKSETLVNSDPVPNLLILHSMTKFYAVAGLRMGGVIGHPSVIERLKNAKEPWTVNGIADKVALLLKRCEGYDNETISFVSKERKRIYENISSIDGVRVFPSSTNFFLCRWDKTENMDDLIKYLMQNSVYIRDCRNFSGLDGNFFRFGIRSAKDNDRLISLLSSFTVDKG
jgi:threonine-phosphate decarboxylase